MDKTAHRRLMAARFQQIVPALALACLFVAPILGHVMVGKPMYAELKMGEWTTENIGPATPGTPRHLMEKHGCWGDGVGAMPADMEGKIPGHVVLTDSTGKLRYSTKLVAPALEQVFLDADHDLTIYGFCR